MIFHLFEVLSRRGFYWHEVGNASFIDDLTIEVWLGVIHSNMQVWHIQFRFMNLSISFRKDPFRKLQELCNMIHNIISKVLRIKKKTKTNIHLWNIYKTKSHKFHRLNCQWKYEKLAFICKIQNLFQYCPNDYDCWRSVVNSLHKTKYH